MRQALLSLMILPFSMLAGCAGDTATERSSEEVQAIANACAAGNLDACAVSQRIERERRAAQAAEIATYGLSNSYNPAVPSASDWR